MSWWYETTEEKKMEFDRSRCYSALNADELRVGDKVIVGSSLLELKANVECNRRCGNIVEIGGECSNRRFAVDDVDGRGETYWELAYLVERAENCTNCKEGRWDAEHKKILCDPVNCGNGNVIFRNHEIEVCEYYKPTTKQKEMCLNCKHYNKVNDFRDCTLVNNPTSACPHYEVEKHYRPFKDTDELIRIWDVKYRYVYGIERINNGLDMPHIWVHRDCTSERCLIVSYTNDSVYLGHRSVSLQELFYDFAFLDGSPCGVEEQ